MSRENETKTLLMTVGVGDAGQLEATLFAPLRKSIAEGEWERVVLLPSSVTRANAARLREMVKEFPIEIRPLPEPGMEDDADRCFGHFDGVLAGLVANGVDPARITADFTRGTKAMSAALALAAAGRGLHSLRYITGRRDRRGTVVPGSERIYDFTPARVTRRRELDLAVRFLAAWQFAGAEQLVPADARLLGLYPAAWRAEAEWIHWLARFWSAWDRFDYREAVRLLDARPQPEAPPLLHRYLPGSGREAFARRLAAELPQAPDRCADPVRDLVADTLENGRRRLRLGELEDALIRAYRALEMIGQVRLFTHGIDSGAADPKQPKIASWIRYKEKKAQKNRKPWKAPSPNREGNLELSRVHVASLLRHLEDPLGRPLSNSDKLEGLAVRSRNNSNLIHGYRAQATTSKRSELTVTYGELERLFLGEDTGNTERMAAARFPFEEAARA